MGEELFKLKDILEMIISLKLVMKTFRLEIRRIFLAIKSLTEAFGAGKLNCFKLTDSWNG